MRQNYNHGYLHSAIRVIPATVHEHFLCAASLLLHDIQIHYHNHNCTNVDSTIPLLTRKQFLESCLLTPTVPDGELCAICLEDYELTPDAADKALQKKSHMRHTLCQIPLCVHKIGFSCLITWAEEHNVCPMRRKKILPGGRERRGSEGRTTEPRNGARAYAWSWVGPR